MARKPSSKTTTPKGGIVINGELCKGCKYCILTCRRGVIALSGDFNSAGYFPAAPGKPEKCTGCALCAEICPEIAIEVWKEI